MMESAFFVLLRRWWPAFAVLSLVIAGLALAAHMFGKGEKAGANKVTVQIQRDHAVAVADARTDERAAVAASSTIATSVAQQTVASAAVTHHIVETLRNAIESVPPATPGDPMPAAPVDRVRDDVNAAIARANRAAAAAPAVAGANPDGAS
ncbi:hypothetical protein [uncultured Sphingomonas sp.]|uniref:hypothetical protein n=1 Tax=uncultured Sphingomonas sp. TaxID=158754 RepID=UPI00259AD657|nr:hypothetical protein [uncultured Sphingomonas sp.]